MTINAAAAQPTAFERYLAQQSMPAPVEAVVIPIRRTPLTPVSKREVAWALALTVLLLAGILGTLLLRTSMQSQARALQRANQTASTLNDRALGLRHTLNRDANPESLAAKARALQLRPQGTPKFVTRHH